MSRKSKRLKKSSSVCDWLNSVSALGLIQHLSENAILVFTFCQVVHKHTLFEVPKQNVFWLPTLSVTFLPKKYQNPFTCVKVLASQRWDILFETGVNVGQLAHVGWW